MRSIVVMASAHRGLGLVVTVVLSTGAVYFGAKSRAGNGRQAAGTGPLVPLGSQGRPFEGAGIEGTFTPEGMRITALDGAARSTGLLAGDVIQRVDGQPFLSAVQLRLLAPGAPVQIVRDGQPVVVTITQTGNPNQVDVRAVEVRGVAGQLTPEGLWVTAAEGEGSSWGLLPGDLVRAVDGRPLTVRRDAVSLLRGLDPTRGFVLEVVRGGTRIALPVLAAVAPQPQAGWLAR